ncbi:hypothetical protein TNCV_4830841 [Trichonephila clavipes]|nr:hypothetical protein TNCV_4830841 [Trichonephila clavipes]
MDILSDAQKENPEEDWNSKTYNDSFPTTENITFSRIGGKRRKGRPLTMCLDNVENNLRIVGVNLWGAIAPDMVRWRRLGQTALACNRL